jgi:sigma-B regulation protein RsbU (phosphoserine phosphatase)
MANLQATLRGQSLHEIPVRERISRSNELLFRSTDPEKFATLFYGVLDLQHHTITFSNAGHENPYLIKRAGDVVRLIVGGTVLGIVSQFPFEEDVVAFDRGDILVVFSDGISEAFNAADEQFGEARLEEVVRSSKNDSAEAIIDRVVEEVRRHAGDIPQADDLTLVVVKRAA